MTDVPWLRRGCGKTPADGGCILQVIDWISRGKWTNSPPCVHLILRRAAAVANDLALDDVRQQLLELAPRMIGTNDVPPSWSDMDRLGRAIVQKLLPRTDPFSWRVKLRMYITTRRRNPVEAFLDVLRTFERLTGRLPAGKAVDWRPVCEAMRREPE